MSLEKSKTTASPETQCPSSPPHPDLDLDLVASSTTAKERPDPPPSPPPRPTTWRNIYALLSYTPKRCRYDPDHPPGFSLWLNLLFGFAATFTVANLYYNHPILNKLAESFQVTYEQVSVIPTLMQAGYAAGLLFLCPLGDIFRRRAFVLLLVWFTATIWYVCVCQSISIVRLGELRFGGR